ncbi:MAG: hypothetical protein QM767_04145 [Anaeromyxobacter sp.]
MAAAQWTASVGESKAKVEPPSSARMRRPPNSATSGSTSASWAARCRARKDGEAARAQASQPATWTRTSVRLAIAGVWAAGMPRRLARAASSGGGGAAGGSGWVRRSGRSARSSSAISSRAEPGRRARSFSVARATTSSRRG